MFYKLRYLLSLLLFLIIPHVFSVDAQEPTKHQEERTQYYSIRMNMLYGLAAIPSFGAEYYFGKNWSIAGQWHYAKWNSTRKNTFWQTYGGDLEIRYWVGSRAHEKPLTGHHLGLYGQMITYDFEWRGNKGYQAPDWNYGGGLAYGYSAPISTHLNIDFTLGVGYLGGDYMEYLPIDGHYVWQVSKKRKWFGPTKAEISLVWLLGKGNINQKKQKGDAR